MFVDGRVYVRPCISDYMSANVFSASLGDRCVGDCASSHEFNWGYSRTMYCAVLEYYGVPYMIALSHLSQPAPVDSAGLA